MNPKFTAYVSNINFTTDSKTLGEFFNQFGVIESARVATERFRGRIRSRGFGFVDFKTQESLNAAITASGATLDGRKINIRIGYPPKPRIWDTIFVGGIPKGSTVEELLNAFRQYNPLQAKIVKEDGERKGFGFIKFGNENVQKQVCETLKTIPFKGGESVIRRARRGFDLPPRRVFRRAPKPEQ